MILKNSKLKIDANSSPIFNVINDTCLITFGCKIYENKIIPRKIRAKLVIDFEGRYILMTSSKTIGAEEFVIHLPNHSLLYKVASQILVN